MAKKKKNLVIVESPAKAKSIGKYLGRNYKVVASLGHLRDLPKSRMGIDLEGDFDPDYITIRGKGKICNELRKEARKAKKIYLATDPDREGEAIAWHLTYILKLEDNEIHRVTFNEITKEAVKAAIKNAREIDKQLVDAQQARRLIDRLVGYSISPLLWEKVRRGLSAGRVQSVATKLICEREKEINKFKPQEYWKIDVDLAKKKKTLEAAYYGEKGKKKKLNNEDEVKYVLNKIDNTNFVIEKIKESKRNRKPYKPFTTSSLQQEASNKLSFSTKKTMMLAQQLYEGIKIGGEGIQGLITYMRTDSTRISDIAHNKAIAYITEKYSAKYTRTFKNNKKKKSDNKKIQDAHEAIRPTDVFRSPDEIKQYLSKDQFKLYRLIWSRFVASRMKNAIFNYCSIDFDANGQTFRTTGSQMDFDGFIKVYDYVSVSETFLPELSEGEAFECTSVNPTQHFTKPPARYSEATLVKEMESKGIGRPSTYSPTISTILARNYVEFENKYLKPTELGILINDIMEEHFKKIVGVSFTADLEEKFDQVELGDIYWKDIMRSFYTPFKETLDKAEKTLKKIDLTEETDIECDKCGSNMVIKYGRYGKFLACSSYPDCKNTKPLLKKIDVDCPKCGGDIVKRKSKKRRYFYGCNNYPDCDFVTWQQPINKKCPDCGSILTQKNYKSKKVISCSNKECSYKEEQKKN